MEFVKLLQGIFKNPLVKKIFGSGVFKILIAVVAVLVLYKLIKTLVAKFKKKLPAKAKEDEKKLTAGGLAKIAKDFRRQIPSEYRRSISLYQPYIVFGDAGSGKSLLIDNYTDWRGQSYQFYPSYTQDPDLQIYLGSQVLVQEVPPALLQDKSTTARKALLRLWRRFSRKRDPIAVIVLKASALNSISPSALRQQAQMIRGKVNLLAKLRGKRIKTHIVLTHMDQVEGYQAFAKFIKEHNIALKIEIDENTGELECKNCLEPYEKYLPLALTTVSAPDYNDIITFFKSAPGCFASVYHFVQTLLEYDPLSEAPQIGKLHLASNTLEDKVANPFEPNWVKGLMPTMDEYRQKHRFAAAVFALAGAIFLGSSYFLEWTQWQQINTALAEFEQEPSFNKQKAANDKIAEIVAEKELLHTKLMPTFLKSPETQAKRRFLEKIRSYYLIPAVERIKREANPHEPLLYLMAVMYGSRHDDLGRMVLKNIDVWDENIDFGKSNVMGYAKKEIIEDYISNSDNAWTEFLRLEEIPYTKEVGTAVDDVQPWLVYLLEMQEIFEQYAITPAELQEIQEDGAVLAEAMDQVQRFLLAQDIYDQLSKLENLEIKKAYKPFLAKLRMSKWIRDNASQLEEFFALIDKHRINAVPARDLNLRKFMKHLDGMIQLTNVPEKVFYFTLAEQNFRFDAKRWVTLIQASKIRLLIQDFIRYNKADTGDLFFTSKSKQLYPDIVMNRYNDGSFLFTGKGGEATIPGRYSKRAYEKEVQPILVEMTQLLEKLPVSQHDKTLLSNFVFREARNYGRWYRIHYERYFLSFGVKAESIGDLNIIFEQMQAPSSPFDDFLQTIHRNTALAEPENLYLREVYKGLLPFQYINAVIAPSSKDSFPELGKYFAIIQEIQKGLTGVGGEGEEKKAEGAGEEGEQAPLAFVDTLSPLGRVSLPIFLDQKQSFLAIAKRWLNSVGIVGKWQKPFIAPIYQMYYLGEKDIETAVAQNWERRLVPIIQPVLIQYPFANNADKDITPEELGQKLHPTGTFWQEFDNSIAPVCVKSRKGNWLPHISSLGKLKMPRGMLRTVNRLDRLTRALWDKNGNPTPLVFLASGYRLPKVKEGKDIVLLSYLSVGEKGVYSFNQRSSPQLLSVDWWKQQTAQVTMQISDAQLSKKSYKTVDVSQSWWSLYQLLQKGTQIEENVWSWQVDTSSDLEVKFSIDDPWRLFDIGDLQQK